MILLKILAKVHSRLALIFPSPARQVQRCVSVQHPAISCVLPHHLGVSLQQQVHSVLDVTNKDKVFTLKVLLCHLASILSRVVQGRLLPDVLDVGLRPGVQQLLDTLEVAVLGGAVQSRLLVTVSEIHIWDTRTHSDVVDEMDDCVSPM